MQAFLLIGHLILGIFTYCFAAVVQQEIFKNTALSPHPVILVVSYDGFRYDYFNKAKSTPWLNALRTSGVSVPYMEPTFPTKTFPNHQSIATGLYAESHGIVDNVFYDPLYNKTLNGYGEPDPEFWNYNPEVLPIWIRNEMAAEGRFSGCYMWPGSSNPYGPKDNLLPTYYRSYDESVPWESRVDTVISWITNDKKPTNLNFLYFDEPDTHGHAFGPNSEETLNQVEEADNRTAYLVNKLVEMGIFNKINLIILSDHGMKEVTQERIINLHDLVDESLIEAEYGSTPVIQLVPAFEKEDELYDQLTELSNTNNFVVWRKHEMDHPFHYNTSRRIADLVVLADPGYAFDDFNKTIQRYNEKRNLTADDTIEYGVHGYSNVAASMRAIFMAHGPAFRRGFEYPPIKNVDIVPLISKILGLPDIPTNGSLDRVFDMIDPSILSNSAKGIHRMNPLNILALVVAILIKM